MSTAAASPPGAQPPTSGPTLADEDGAGRAEAGAEAGAGQGDGDPPGPPAQSNAPPLLPSSCLAALLNYLPFRDVRQCLLAGKVMAVGAAREVETLNIMKASEMVAPAVRRFPNVSKLNILCILWSRSDDDDDDEPVLNLLSANAIRRAVPFMVQFSKLRGVFLGGLDEVQGCFLHYSNDVDIRPHDHQIVFHGLIENLCGAFGGPTFGSQP